MRSSMAIATLASFATLASANLNILMSNDDGWGSANIRAAKTALEADGHRVLIIGPLDNQSGVGGAVNLPRSNVSETGGLYGLATPGASYYGYNETDTSLRYFNGTPAACVLWGLTGNRSLDYLPTVDLIVSGPNEGTNLGAFVYSLSGTCGAASAAAMFGVPSIAFSARNSTHRPYTSIIDSPYDPAVLAGKLVATLVSTLADGWDRNSGKPLMPITTGLNVNFPYLNESCSEPPYILSRLTGGAYIDDFELNEDGFPEYINIERPGVNTCVNGDCSLPGETDIVTTCQSSISVFSVDYDAPKALAAPVQEHIKNYLAPHANRRMKRSLTARDANIRRKAL